MSVTLHDDGYLEKEGMMVYVAGPYVPKNCSLHDAALVAQRNTEVAMEAGWAIINKGHYPYVPHLSHFMHLFTPKDMAPIPGEFWYAFDLVFLEVCDAILMLPKYKESHGAVLELEAAIKMGLTVYYDVNEIPEVEE
jgi:hypothetical protein